MRGQQQPGFVISSPVETLLRSLLHADGRRDAETRVVEGVRSLLMADWVALFEEEGAAWVCRSSSGPCPDHLQPSIDATADSLAVNLDLSSGRATLLLGSRQDGQAYPGAKRHLLARIGPDLAYALRKGDEVDSLRAQAFVDALTDCYNRRGFDEHLQVELRRAQRYERSAALMLIDLDGFKSINDELGHQAGDHVLRRFSALLASTFRNTDVISRYGGDEFAVIFPETTSAEAVRMAQRVRLMSRDLFPDAVIPRPVSASFGIASYPAEASSAQQLVAIADHALYAAKTGGRDQVVAGRSPDDLAR
jgi:diguanylate cyclase (GGDEF)-like protein